jgi:hypothetical protein
MAGKEKQQRSVTISLTEKDNKVITEYRKLILEKLGVDLTPAKAARALLHQAAKAGAEEMAAARDTAD